MASIRPLSRLLVALGVVVLVAGCSDDGGDTTSAGAAASSDGPTTTDLAGIDPDVAAEACEGLEATILLPVEEEPPDDDSVLEDALNTLAETRPNPVGEDAATVRVVIGAEGDPEVEALPDEALDALVVDAFEALERVQDWGRSACGVEGVTWSCPATDGVTKFEPVGMAIDGESTTTTTEPGAATPEEVFAEGESDGEPVIVSEGDDEVVAAWLDDDGTAVEVITVVEDGGWRSDGTESCLTAEELVAPPKFDTVPAAIGDAGEPEPGE